MAETHTHLLAGPGVPGAGPRELESQTSMGGGGRNLRQQHFMLPNQVTCGPLLMPDPGKMTSIPPGIIRRSHSSAPFGVQGWHGWGLWVTPTHYQVPRTRIEC